MKSKNNLITGKIGEDFATNYLKSLGYKIVDRNFHQNYSEIDIVAIVEETLVFVEVKTRHNNAYGLPEEAVFGHKLKSLIRASQYYQLTHPSLPTRSRIDVISVLLDENNHPKSWKLFKNITL